MEIKTLLRLYQGVYSSLFLGRFFAWIMNKGAPACVLNIYITHKHVHKYKGMEEEGGKEREKER